MAFKATNVIPADAYNSARRTIAGLKNYSQDMATVLASDTAANEILAIRDRMLATKTRLQGYASVSGIAAYAQAQEDDVNYNVATEFTALIAAMDAVVSSIETTFPTDNPTAWLLEKEFDPGVGFTYRVFSAAALSPLRTLVQAVDAAIE